VLTSHCNRRGRRRKGEQPRPTGGLPGCCPPATPPPHVQPPGERAQTPTAVESGCIATRSGLLAPATGRNQPPRAARHRLTAEEDEPQPDLQARCPTGAVRPSPRSPTRKKHAPGRRRESRTTRGEESLAATFLARPSGCAEGPAPAAARRRGRERRWRREGVGVASRVASQTTRGPLLSQLLTIL
jgi:hypothetical protein